MISFVSSENFFSMYPVLNESEKSLALEYLSEDCDFGDFEVLYAYCHGALLLRYYSPEAGYHFEAPVPLSGGCDFAAAYREIGEYCKAEAIPEVVVGVLPEHKDLILRGAEHYNSAEDEDGSFVFEILTECMLTDELPELLYDDVYLGEFSLTYAEKYEKLVKNVNLNRYFGYNFTDDMPDGDGADFIRMAREDFERSESMTFAATVLSEDGENVFVGEGTLFGFDGRGGASISFRVLPEYHRQGIGKKIFCGLVRIAAQIGLTTVIGEVMAANTASLNLISKYADSSERDSEKYRFTFDVAAFEAKIRSDSEPK